MSDNPLLVLNPLPSIRVETVFGFARSNNLYNLSDQPSYNLISCTIYSEVFTNTFTFTHRNHTSAIKFLRLCNSTSYRLKLYKQKRLSDTSNNYSHLIQPLLRIIREIFDGFVTENPTTPVFTTFTNFTRDHFSATPPDELNPFKKFLVGFYNHLDLLQHIPNPELQEHLNCIIETIDTAYCMTLAFTKFAIHLEIDLNTIDRRDLDGLVKRRFDIFTERALKRPSFYVIP